MVPILYSNVTISTFSLVSLSNLIILKIFLLLCDKAIVARNLFQKIVLECNTPYGVNLIPKFDREEKYLKQILKKGKSHILHHSLDFKKLLQASNPILIFQFSVD